MLVRDAWRLAVGTLTAMPVPPPEHVDRRRAAVAMALAPLAALPLALGAAAIALLGQFAGLPHLVTALLAIGVVVVGNRALHLDGLADTVDGMAASYDCERSLEVMKTGTSGPAGVTAIVLVLGLQVAALASLLDGAAIPSAVLAAVTVCASRAALALCCTRGVRPAREDGLGRTFTQTLSPLVTALVWIAVAAALAGAGAWAGLPWWRGVLAAAVAAAVVGAIILRAIRRFGGVTGDVFGAAVEAALAALLVTFA
ncbi:adenosylcobinamide-GDP ribazoletransferase [Nocardioides albus]|uniref:Adenosylcobinamide-GDP ribazoletransferase n=1 Tax=Nocardioides albus TaxID=1841 RepID=A0A7W5A7I7_9ACTN|nr:adenosylcobinamide-GDP ribazoletransferase [Nocardioides albus]MBB3090993.1 adenosylcobinamide-GDP ribazoletransferase [Nocardioides albus]GGU38844.1 adenosylcobinamide-GDP ribazoletransferase [Nocardioides albus]